jgi:5-methylcytosine-specific restriction endonuclease McrBC regulatory subunit McrC
MMSAIGKKNCTKSRSNALEWYHVNKKHLPYLKEIKSNRTLSHSLCSVFFALVAKYINPLISKAFKAIKSW